MPIGQNAERTRPKKVESARSAKKNGLLQVLNPCITTTAHAERRTASEYARVIRIPPAVATQELVCLCFAWVSPRRFTQRTEILGASSHFPREKSGAGRTGASGETRRSGSSRMHEKRETVGRVWTQERDGALGRGLTLGSTGKARALGDGVRPPQ